MAATNSSTTSDGTPLLYPTVYVSPMKDSKKPQSMLGLGGGFIAAGSRDRSSWCNSVASSSYNGSLEEKLRQAEHDVRRLSGMDSLKDGDDGSIITWNMRKQARQSTSTRGWIDIGLEDEREHSKQSDLSPMPPYLHLPSFPSTPEPLFSPSPEPVELDATTTQHVCRSATRSRQSSCASSRFHARPTHKIASSRSRGLRSDTCPEFSRPTSLLKPVPGEDMERDPLHIRYMGEPPTPNSPPPKDPFMFDDVKEARNHIEQQLKQAMADQSNPKPNMEQEARPKKMRWSSLPSSLMKLTKRHSKPEEDMLVNAHKKHRDQKTDNSIVTNDNLQSWVDEAGHIQNMHRTGRDSFVSSPVQVDMMTHENYSHSILIPPTIPSPQYQDFGPTPPSSPSLAQIRLQQRSHHQNSPSFSGAFPSPLPTPPPERPRSLLSLASQKEFAAEKANTLFTCTVCKEAEHPSTFPLRKITKSCMHPTRTCLDCLRNWIDTCVREGRWEGCTCPECGLTMSTEDVDAFSSAGGFMR
ncbi:unnamed protein product [Periconia digitata]|uniref:RING-type domain-containing protein n=1 Tax=Periconia digitata TaxID=1303443 RepID=A0A9W4U479_9PLEO|nr:unnamed protein product [Periconia digitata]